MTSPQVGAVAPASLSQAHSATHLSSVHPPSRRRARKPKPWERYDVRFVWLVMRLASGEDISYRVYRTRFDRCVRSYYRDIAVLREAGLYIVPEGRGRYRFVCFCGDLEAV